MPLNAVQLARRIGKLGGSDMRILMGGSGDDLNKLYRQKIGEELPEDLSRVWPVQLGVATEQLNLDWFQPAPVTRRGDVVMHPYLDWAMVTLDGWSDELECPVEAKHVGGREPIEVIIERYMPQCQWQMEVTGADQCALSIIVGANPPVVEFLERNAEYAEQLIKQGEAFMACVRERRLPVDLPPFPAPVNFKKVYDMLGVEQWAQHAGIWLQCVGAVESGKNAEKILKSLVPEDAKKAFGHGVRITRDRAGRLSLREDQP